MIIRTLQLKGIINQFCKGYRPIKPLSLSTIEWKKLSYLINLLRPFNFFIIIISKIISIILPYTLSIYNKLYEHLIKS